GEAEVANLSLVLEPRHFADRIFDRHVGIDAVLIIEIDRVDPEPLEARVAGGADIFGVAAHAEELAIRPTHIGELGGEEDLVAAAADRSADQLLVLERPVHVGGVEEGNALVERVMDGRNRLLVVAASVKLAHAHAAETDRGNFGTVAAEAAPGKHEHKSS